MRKLIFPLLIFLFYSCDKNKEMVRYTELYHIEGTDTISAIYIPNSFTPDWDGQNDYFETKEEGILSDYFSMEIYNANGMLIFQIENIDMNWDGSYKGLIAPSGTYTLNIIAKDSTGFIFNHTQQIESMR
jgi:gliding motility-associated-like protein